jgi:protein phosphatase 1 regulatory subunit 11
LNKKKSKCCCIYQKPHNFDESSSEDEHEDKDCLHCKGHRKTDYNSQKEKQNEPNSVETQYLEEK